MLKVSLPNFQLIQYKALHRTHYTEQRMFKMGLALSDTCVHARKAHLITFCMLCGNVYQYINSGSEFAKTCLHA